jgi:pimeloyl-ACP methyl ester carboxylesterase
MTSTYSLENIPRRMAEDGARDASRYENLLFAFSRRAERLAREHGKRVQQLWADAADAQRRIAASAKDGRLANDAQAYATDATQRGVLMLDILRERADQDAAHEAAGTPPVLIYDHEIILDGKTLPRPCNKVLLRIVPPEGVDVDEKKRPFMIVDPRAGHGAGIGGFKPDSQVGVALRKGHPVYFVVFRQHAEPGQTLADVMHAEAEFVAEVGRRHPGAPKPVVVGNCQGGWATMIMAACNPEFTGPIVINGAPLSYWAGRLGENAMRYNGGLLGGGLAALLSSDLGNGEFDGAYLVANFENLNPGRNHFGKYYDVFAAPEKERKKFLEFEKWWGGYQFLSEQEIHWIVEELFIGNKLARGEARLEHGVAIDLKKIRSPIIVFASFGDNITPPQQALNWILDTYADEKEIKILGQRIIYMVHEKVGHLGIFVSSSVARKEHAEVTSTVETIEGLVPGLYEMRIDEVIGEGIHAQFTVSFHERTFADLLAVDDGRADEQYFAAVQRFSELTTEFYEIFLRPLIQPLVTEQSAEILRKLNPGRVSRGVFGQANPLMKGVPEQAAKTLAERKPADPANPFLFVEKAVASSVEFGLDVLRDWRDTFYEAAFLNIYGAPLIRRFGEPLAFQRTQPDPKKLRFLPQVQAILLGVGRGGFEEAVIRMLILLAEAQAEIGLDRLEVSAEVLSQDEPFASLAPERRTALIQEQSIIVEFEPELAVKTLPDLLPKPEDRKRAVELVRFIAGPVVKMEPKTIQTLETFHTILGLQPLALAPPTKDPLKISTVVAALDDVVKVVTDAAPGVEAPKSEAALGAVKGKAKMKDEGASVG